MDVSRQDRVSETALEEILGYLNFSSGRSDPRVWRNFSDVFGQLEQAADASARPWEELRALLAAELDKLRATKPAFGECEQARAVLRLAFDQVLPAYRQFHHDLLFHQRDRELYRPYFVARVCDTVLGVGGPWDEEQRIVSNTIAGLNSFLGHRPVAVLENERKLAPYPHEWIAPVPLYLAGAGVAVGRYHDLIARTLEILRETDPDLLAEASFDFERFDELAFDPRAYDFYHPVNRRPNYQFGQWDPHLIDNRGFYRRFVVQQVTLDTLLSRVTQSELPRDEVLSEAASVLAGTMLMASAMSGHGPEAHDSSVTLATLVPRIAALRDAFYLGRLSKTQGPHGERLQAEAQALRQPFGGTRQHLNQHLARLRAGQLERAHLAQIYARMGFPEAALEQAQEVSVAGVRMMCEIECLRKQCRRAASEGDFPAAVAGLTEIGGLLHRAIECGALVDPWNVLGFQGQFSVFRALENSIRDHRIGQLVSLIENIFGTLAEVHRAAAAAGRGDIEGQVSEQFERLADWWDRFATTAVSGLRSVSGAEALTSARQVSRALLTWHAAGSSAGNIAFWREHAEHFASPQTFALVVEALLDAHDYIASMALLMAWLNRSSDVPLEEGGRSFHDLAARWMQDVVPPPGEPDATERWSLVTRFFDHLEANADELWSVPSFALQAETKSNDPLPPHQDAAGRGDAFADDELGDADSVSDDDDEDLFGAAWEDVTYRDSTDDGIEGETLDVSSPTSELELEQEASRLGRRLSLIATYARLWRLAAERATHPLVPSAPHDYLQAWLARSLVNRSQLDALLTAIFRHRMAQSIGPNESLVEYDRKRMVQQALLDRVVDAYVATSDAARWLCAALPHDAPLETGDLVLWEQQTAQVFRALMAGDPAAVRAVFQPLCRSLLEQPLLYVPLARRGDPRRKAVAQSVQMVLRDLLAALPRLGLLTETITLVDLAQEMEKRNPVGAGAVTEFNRLFQVAFTAVVEALVAATPGAATQHAADDDEALVECIESATEVFLGRWLRHSRSARISVLERVANDEKWQELRKFIEEYGEDLFTQKFLNVGNLRAILHQGIDLYLHMLAESGDDVPAVVAALDTGLNREVIVAQLELILEAVIENYAEYEDYNTTTTQSDHGALLYTLLAFLRLKASYERVAWNLKPVVLAHEVLVRSGRGAAAELWRRSLADKTADIADWHLARLEELVMQHGMRLASVADRLGERFVRPLDMGRIRALVAPAMQAARAEPGDPAEATATFVRLATEIDEFLQTPTGAGIDLPPWLASLEEEVEAIELVTSAERRGRETTLEVPRAPVTRAELNRQIEQCPSELELDP
ncbi:MAG: hypothetical protein KF708_10130 [Pirellulales bacterium]|nr:hypothetical protein [Pirellulales bacterium]